MGDITSAVRSVPIEWYLILSTILFSIGVFGILLRRNLIVAFMSIELMLNAVNLLLTAFASYRGDTSGQVFVFFIMVVAAAEVAVGLSILVMTHRNTRSVDINALSNLKW